MTLDGPDRVFAVVAPGPIRVQDVFQELGHKGGSRTNDDKVDAVAPVERPGYDDGSARLSGPDDDEVASAAASTADARWPS